MIENCYHYDYNHFLDDNPILEKSPNSSEVFDLIKCHADRWDEFGIELQVSLETRDSLRHDVALGDRSRLDRVVMKWIQSQCSPVTWKNIIHTLESMDLKVTARKVQDYLKHQVITKSSCKQLYMTLLIQQMGTF